MTRKTVLTIVAAAGLAIVLFSGWFLFIRDDAPPPVSLGAAVEQAVSTTQGGAAVTTSTATAGSGDESADGEWLIVPSDSFVGYRVKEELSGIGASVAVGRTDAVVGSLSVSGAQVTAVAIDVDMTMLESDSGTRDNQLKNWGLETSSFPSATFVLSQPMELGSEPQVGQPISTVAVGDLTLHGVTRQVEIPMEAEFVDGTTIVVVGSLDLLITDFGIEAPVGFKVLSINENGTIEMQLIFSR